MKNIAIIITVATLFMAQISKAQQKEVTIPFTDSAAEKHLKIHVFNGEISITGSNRSDVLVKYEAKENSDESMSSGRSDSKGLKKISGSSLGLTIEENNNHIKIESSNWNYQLSLNIEVPQSIALEVFKNIGGQINVENTTGNVNIENNVGDIYVKGVSGLVNASSNAGKINVEFDDIPDPKSMRFTTTAGEIDITLPVDYKADLKMRTEMGDIYSDLDIVALPVEPETQKSENGGFKFTSDIWTRATLNGGGAEIVMKSHVGSIYLRKK